jgi:stage III sporulation protein SpoIIIAA
LKFYALVDAKIHPENESNGRAMVMISGIENPTGEILVYDLIGRLVQTQAINNSSNSVPMNNMHGMFIVKVQTEKEVVSKKIFIN